MAQPISKADCSSSSSSLSESENGDWSDWQSESGSKTFSLFAQESKLVTLSSPLQVLQHSKQLGCDVPAIVKRLDLDTIGVIRLINHIRRNKLSVEQVNALKGDELFLSDDKELTPVEGFEDDGMLQLDFDELASGDAKEQHEGEGEELKGRRRIEELESELLATRLTLGEVRDRLAEQMGIPSNNKDDDDNANSNADGGKGRIGSFKPKSVRPDDDTHYFDSYANNDIHQVMLQDRARTLTYAKFLLSPANAHLIRGKVVMDVGCGSGILSLFCARAGAARVLAIDASDIADRASQNIEENGYAHIIQIYKGKLEDLSKPLAPFQGKVDLIISEWMGYFLLYESMLPSVLHARDLYLNPQTGILAPNYFTMDMALFSSTEMVFEKLKFWDDVYGFKMSAMKKGLVDEAFVETLEPESIVSNSINLARFNLNKIQSKQPEFSTAFEMIVTKQVDQIDGFVSWFDTWFFPTSCPPPTDSDLDLESVPKCRVSEILQEEIQWNPPATPSQSNEQQEEQGKGEIISFSTSPLAHLSTHWKQTLFLLKYPIVDVEIGSIIQGEIKVTQSRENSRELDVEIHYLHKSPSQTLKDEEHGKQEKKRVVDAKLVQFFRVR